MKIKVIVENGNVVNVLKNGNEPVDVELEDYRDELYANPDYQEVDFSSANFEEPPV